MYRYEIINEIIREKNFTKYIEIGLRDPGDCFDIIQCEEKHSVDPGYEVETNHATYKFTSDDFFLNLENKILDLPTDYKWDVIFIDGLHISYQVERDVLNSLNHLTEGGYIVLHDCNPFLYEYDYRRVIEDYWGQCWNGTVWKTIYKLLCTRGDLDVYTINTDEGLGIIKRGNGRDLIDFDNPYFEYKLMSKNITKNLNTIEIEDFKKMIAL